ncbi:hypothetical protein GCM10009625_04670 [Brachybacterium fresconis]
MDFGIREIPEFAESGLEILVLLQFCIAKATLSTVTGCTYIFLPTIGARYTWSGCERAPQRNCRRDSKYEIATICSHVNHIPAIVGVP